MNLQVKDLVTGDHHVLIMSDEPRVYAMGENTLYGYGLNETIENVVGLLFILRLLVFIMN